jgi:integrase/recombinase XerC
VVKAGKTPVLTPEEARALIDAIEITTPVGLRDRAPIGLMVFSFARIGAALGKKVEDVFTRRLWVRLREKGGKAHAMPCHHNLETYLAAASGTVSINRGLLRVKPLLPGQGFPKVCERQTGHAG